MGCLKDYNSKIKYTFQIITLLSFSSLFIQGCGPGNFESLSNDVKQESPPSVADSNGRGPSCSDGATQSCGSDVGICQSGIQTCSGQEWGSCVDEIAAGPELCGDGLDNDCDGSVDDGCSSAACTPGTTQSCGSNVGACQSGTETCNEGEWSLCNGEIGPSKEICGDGIDNDCNGLIDIGCTSGGACTDGETRNCGGPEIGACQFGTETCNGGEWSACTGEVAPLPEVCSDGIDNNCNGSTDESCTPVAPCSKQSGADWVNEPNWPVTSIVLGNKRYSQSELLAIINSGGEDMSIDLSTSLVGALLNYAAGAAPSIDLSTAQQWMIDFDDGDGLPYAVNLSDPGAIEALAIIAYIDSYNSDAVACEVNSTNVVPLTCANVAPLADVVPPQSLAGAGGYFTSTSKLGVVKTMQGQINLSASIDDNLEVRVNNWLEVAKPYFGLNDLSKDLELLEIIDLDTNESAESIFTKPNANISVRFIRKINYLRVLGSGLNIRVQSTADATTGLPVVSIKFIWSKLPYNDMLVSEHDLIGNNRAKLNGLEGLTATEAEVEQIVFSGTTQNGCANFSRLAWKVTPANPGRGEPGFRIIDGGHGGILMSQRTVFNLTDVVDAEGNKVTTPYSVEQLYAAVYVEDATKYFMERGIDPGDQAVDYNPFDPVSHYYSTAAVINSQGEVVRTGVIEISAWNLNQATATHEVFHAVFEKFYKLKSSQSQSAAINEAGASLASWEHTGVLPTPFDPSESQHVLDNKLPVYNPDTLMTDFFEHYNAQPLRNAFYCAAVGCAEGDIEGVGISEAMDMFYGALEEAGGWQKNLTFDEFYDLVQAYGLRTGQEEYCGAVLKALNRNGIGRPDQDQDQDCVPDSQDNCPTQFNPLQDDDNGFANDDGIGDACEHPPAANSFLVVWDYGTGDGYHSKLESCRPSLGTTPTGSPNLNMYRTAVGVKHKGSRTNGHGNLPGSQLQGTFQGLPSDSYHKGLPLEPWSYTIHAPYFLGNNMDEDDGIVNFRLMLRPFVGGAKWCSWTSILDNGWAYKPYGSPVAARTFYHDFSKVKFIAENGDVWHYSTGSSSGYYKSYTKRVSMWLTKVP